MNLEEYPMEDLMSNFESVGEFHRRFGLPRHGDGGPVSGLDQEKFLFRDKFMQEELDEFREAHYAGDLPKALDALVDLVYVVLGTAHMMRAPFDEAFREVQRANMTKVRAAGADDPRSTRGSALDVVKPAGWTPPDVAGVLRRAGWDGGYSCDPA